ncbi:putative Ig domain-containing protein [Subtercola boreus]|uniref:Ig-like domain-containing protein n=1 Tax=Subtercola boreus TaxID=120213 RepID=A0A3E0WH99_9MICO|nr:putative Ig domain-containing protein [Subtercola boreus]RFA23522.1 hypothetical protein B7R24_01140 [Subtercola boreus]RFA23916.1 hypothetical protein B7R23_01140 [Subtercola boreus]RFA29615.1 hypothetical protein B7R25_01135 [Subtercola boreus]
MKLSKMVAGAAVAVLLGAGLVTGGSAGLASANSQALNHRPLACKRGSDVIGGLQPDMGCGYRGSSGGGASGDPTGGPTWGYDRSIYTDTKDFSPWEVLNNTKLFPSSDSGYECTPASNGSNLCERSTAQSPLPGIDNASLSQLKAQANRGSVLSWVEDDSIHCTSTLQCFKTTVVFPKYTADAMYTYSSSGELNTPQVSWYRNDGKGTGGTGTYIGTSKGFLSVDSSADADIENANSVSVSSTISPTSVSGSDKRADYSVSVRAATGGSTLVRLHVVGFRDTTEDSIPSDWVRLSDLSSEYVVYLIPSLNPGDISTARLHLTVTGLAEAYVVADGNGTTASSVVQVRPDSPVCTTPGTKEGKGVAAVGTQATLLRGIHCTTPVSTTLKAWTGDSRGAGAFRVVSDEISYTPASATYTGDDTIFVYTENAAGVASLPTAIHVRVGGSAVSADDDQTVDADTPLVLDAANGLTANDIFPSGRDGWSAAVDANPATGKVNVAADGSLRFDPAQSFTGDVSFTYHLNGPLGARSETSTVTIHVVSDQPPTAVLGQSYSYSGHTSLGSSSQFQVTSGSLPDGLKIDRRTGAISGTPTKPGTFHFTVKITGQGGSAVRTIDMAVVDPSVSDDE